MRTMQRYSAMLLWLIIGALLGTSPVWAAPAPAPTTAAPEEAPVDAGRPLPAPITIEAAGRTFHMRGVILEQANVGLIAITDPQTRALFDLYTSSLAWSGGTAVVKVDALETRLAANAREGCRSDGMRFPVEIPVTVVDGVPHLPVALLPTLLPGRLQATGSGHYIFDPLVTSLDAESQEGGGVRLTIESRVPMTHQTFVLRHPRRYVLNIPHVALDLERYHEVQNRRLQHPELGEVRFDQFSFHPNVLRVVFPLKDDYEVRVLPRSTPRRMLVTINRPSVQAHSDELSTQKITDMKIEHAPGLLRVVLRSTGPFQYEWHRLKSPDTRFFLDIPKAVLAGPRREIDVNDEWVSGVRIGQYQTEPIPTVRVRVDLEKVADTTVSTSPTEPNTLVLEVRHRLVSDDSTGLNGVGVCGVPFAVSPVNTTRPTVTPVKPTEENPTLPPIPVGNGNGRVICIDPGHGGSDCGALNRALNIYEKDVTLDIALRLRNQLAARGWHVVLTRTTDRDLTYPGSPAAEELGARVRVAHAFHADLFVSIHCNSSANTSANGTSTHYFKDSDRILAGVLHPRVVDAIGCPNRGVVRNRFYVLAHCKLPSVLIETAFISNMTEGRKLGDAEQRQKLAEAIADGLGVYVARNTTRKTGMTGR